MVYTTIFQEHNHLSSLIPRIHTDTHTGPIHTHTLVENPSSSTHIHSEDSHTHGMEDTHAHVLLIHSQKVGYTFVYRQMG